jgi:adenylate cyclase
MIIQRHGGTIDKFMGDGIMATFGAAVTSPTYAADALQAVDDIIESAAVWGTELQNENKPPLRMGAAVATGRIIFGAVGDESRMEYTVIGDAVNLSAKLEKHTKSEGVRALCTEDAFDMAIRQGYQPPENREQRKARRIEGVDSAVDIVILAP